jgi:hypothetical protein
VKAINNVSCGDSYTDAATISEVFASAGGFFQVADQSAFVQLAWGKLGDWQWTNEFLADPCNGVLAPGTIGVRFRNAVAGQVAVINAALSLRNEPVIVALPG